MVASEFEEFGEVSLSGGEGGIFVEESSDVLDEFRGRTGMRAMPAPDVGEKQTEGQELTIEGSIAAEDRKPNPVGDLLDVHDVSRRLPGRPAVDAAAAAIIQGNSKDLSESRRPD